jgi:Uncharacterised nucleotidyltransferase
VKPDRIIGAVAGFGLPGSALLPAEPVDARTWREVLELATGDRVTPLLATAVADGALATTPEQHEQAVMAHEQTMRLCVLLERALLDTTLALDRAGIAYRVLKGPGVAHLDYPSPSQRAFGDVDLLVRSPDYERTLQLLIDAGARRRYTEVRPGFDRRWGKGACLVLEDGTQIDVHRTFVAGPFGLSIDLDELFRSDVTVSIGGRELPVLDRESRYLHACFHASLGDRTPRLVALRDVAQMILTTDLDRDRALERARRWRADAVVARAVRLAWSRLSLESTSVLEWAVAHRPDRFQARALRAYTAPSRSYATQVVAGIAAVPGVPEKVAYMRALLLAEPGHLAQRDGSYHRRIHRAWRAYGSTRSAP